ncbi:MAG: hypothetical protein DELT_01252 [Desulfovibrio sp.]
MKIQNEQLQALQQLNEARAKKRPEGAFDAILSEELGQEGASASAVAGQGISSGAAVLGLSQVDGVTGIAQTGEATALAAVAESIEAMLSGLDEYADALSSPQGDLKQAFGILQGMDQNIAAIRESSPDLATRHAGMASLLDEISVITRTETVKMNRGDYL